jgi:NAD(P)-dependent dehydrogenase (short-subunit alcohol dehydrogenase family)
MDEFRGRVAVVTGGGSGLGAEMARAFAREGARIVLADVDAAAMDRVAAEIAAAGGAAIGVRTDVTRPKDVEALASRAFEHYGGVHIVCNNAGVGVYGPLATATDGDWQWVMNVNFWGVVHGVSAFVPRMIEQKEGGHVVNTASMAGLTGMPGLGVYCASKFAVVGLSESLQRELKPAGIGVSVLCPMIVRTNIDASERNRPDDLKNPGAPPSLQQAAYTHARVIEPVEVGKRVVQAIRDKDFYILTHREQQEILEHRAERLRRAASKYATA